MEPQVIKAPETLVQVVMPNATVPFVSQQPADEWLARMFIGQPVHNTTGETVGNVNDLMFDRQGHISSVVIGVGGFLSIGQKVVAVPFNALSYVVRESGERVITAALTTQDLTQAPAFNAFEKTMFDQVKDTALDLSHRAAEKAVDLKDQAARRIGEMQSDKSKRQ